MANILPIYYQIKQKLKRAIINGEYNPGDKIPSENQLAEQFCTTRLTVRRAISILVNEGMLVSEQGQGSFV
jgi:DNA-binding GntR family transcriptional regulator